MDMKMKPSCILCDVHMYFTDALILHRVLIKASAMIAGHGLCGACNEMKAYKIPPIPTSKEFAY